MKLVLSYNAYILSKISIWIFYMLYLVYYVPLLSNLDTWYGVFLSGILIQLTLISFFDNWFRLGRPLLLDWFRVSTFFALVLNFLAIAKDLDSSGSVLANNTVYVASEHALTALIAIFVGLLALKIAEFFSIKRERIKSIQKLLNRNYLLKRSQLFYLFVFCVLIVQFYLLLSGKIGYSSDSQFRFSSYSFLVQIIGSSAPFILLVLAIFRFIYRNPSRILGAFLLVFFCSQVIFGFLSGMKESVLIPIILVAIPYIAGGHKISKNILLIAILFVVVLYPINNNYRDILNSNVSFEQNKVEAIQAAVVMTFSTDFFNLLSSGGESYSSRISLFPIMMYSIQEEESWRDYKNLNRYLVLPIAWVTPRFVFSDKPASDTGSKLYRMITGNTFNSITPSTYGWSFFEGGILPLFFSFLIFGFFVSYIENYFHINRLFGLVVYSITLVSLLKVEADIYFLITGLLQSILVNFFLFAFFIKKS